MRGGIGFETKGKEVIGRENVKIIKMICNISLKPEWTIHAMLCRGIIM